MFSFLNAGFLLAAAAALIPLIIHLFSKRKVKLIEFSSLKHLKAMQRRQVRRLKI
ncbi:MAG: BatA domain-containing protein, partial [candidate division Zixibacteria bacterium]|nr:BatA domain-containing protein [candidate division Zixibacteria bacterium]